MTWLDQGYIFFKAVRQHEQGGFVKRDAWK